MKAWLGSPWVLIAGAFAAVLTFGLNVFEQGWRIKETVMAPAPPQPAIRVESQRSYSSVTASAEMLKLSNVRQLLELEKQFKKTFIEAPPASRQVGVWPVRLLVLNPNKQKLTLHSCKVFAQGSGIFVQRSIGYFFGDAIEKLRAENAEPFIEVDPESARRIDVMFLFPPAPFNLGFYLKDLKDAKDLKESKYQVGPTRLDVHCEDQAGRSLSASATASTWAPPLPRR